MSSFLNDFISMRKGLAKPNEVKGMKPKTPSQKKMMSPAQEVEESSITRIIETKPPRKEVLQYLQRRANDLTLEKMK